MLSPACIPTLKGRFPLSGLGVPGQLGGCRQEPWVGERPGWLLLIPHLPVCPLRWRCWMLLPALRRKVGSG